MKKAGEKIIKKGTLSEGRNKERKLKEGEKKEEGNKER